MNGTIKSFATDRETRKRKGFGFIQPSGGGEQVFFHKSACLGCRFDDLVEGDKVTYEPGNGPKGPRAENVELSA